MDAEVHSKRSDFKYKIGKVKQTPPVLKDSKTGLEYIELKRREGEQVYGVTNFQGNYREDKKLGQGTFGEVYKGIHLGTQRQVAMKKILVKAETELFPITAQREIRILKCMNHRNIIRLIEMVYDHSPTQSASSHSQESAQGSGNADGSKSFYMVLPYMIADLSGILHNPRIKLDMGDIKNMMLQIFEGINYIHCKKFMHRDIKTANILLDHKGILKIADFGLARNYYGPPPNLKYPGGAGVDAKYTSIVVTRWYRAPELVLGDKNYTTAVDIWGIGCVFAEFFEKKPILQGKSDIDQGHVIFQLMGTPTDDDWSLARYLPGAELTRTNYQPTYRERFGKYLNETGLDLLSRLLALDPYNRVTAMKAMKHPFFTEEPLPKAELKLPSEESHETDIPRYKEELHQEMTNLPPKAPSGHVAESVQQPQSQADPVPAPQNSLPPKPRGIPSGPRYNRDAPAQAAKPPNRQLGPPIHQQNAHGNFYSTSGGGSYDRDRDQRYYESYPNNAYPRKNDRYGDDPHFNGYRYRARPYQRPTDWRSNPDSRYQQRPHGSQPGPYYKNTRPHAYKPHERNGQPYHTEHAFGENAHHGALQIKPNTTRTNSSAAASSLSGPPSISASSELTSSSFKGSRGQDETGPPNLHNQQPYANPIDARDGRAHDRTDQQMAPGGRKYVRTSSNSNPNGETGGTTDPNNNSQQRNIVDYY
ncbi:HDL361Cp [Eremothecium sinecaudum]|uniref:Serine/threonine-protein kinase BUR1 n=1 Tax=Eremothecium sinecaudum TaxID=45286 RepID=A0A109UYQ6_9SACH|nr:HDL361Cp [Eremothecium sinecaudum]AMD20383.1 HDL361Cp [Eremothecium sinecaudum]